MIPVSDEVAIDLSTARERKQMFPQIDEFLAYATILDDPEVLTALNWSNYETTALPRVRVAFDE